MALYTITTGKLTLTAAATKSLILVNPASPSFKLRCKVCSLDASAAAAGVQFDVYRTNTLGSPAGTSTTPALTDPGDVAALSTALTALTVEPTSVIVLSSFYLQPLGGLYPDWQPYGAEIKAAGGGARIGLRCTTASGVTPDVLAEFWIDE